MNAAYRLYLSAAVGSGSMSNRIIGLRSAKNRLIQSHPSQIGIDGQNPTFDHGSNEHPKNKLF